MNQWQQLLVTAAWVGTVMTMWVQEKRFRRWSFEALRDKQELCEAWVVLIECKKVLDQHDDFNSRHVAGLIHDLYNRYPVKPREDK